LLRQFVAKGDLLENFFTAQRTRWINQPKQVYELVAALDTGQYTYRLVMDAWGDPPKPRVVSESVHFEGKPVFEFVNGQVGLYNDRIEHKVTYEFDWHRSALATIVPRTDNRILSRFKIWIASLYCFRLNPFAMASRAEGENLWPNVDLSNIASWYRHLLQADPKENMALVASLRESLDGFTFLKLEAAGENVRLLAAEFGEYGGRPVNFFLNKLSEGQRCLICLYTILHFVLAKGCTVIIDEPDNFLSLREIQPWLMAATDLVEDRKGQLILISHHPEIINQLAANNGVRFVRDRGGPVRVEKFQGDPESCLPPSELIARGWECE
jgi:hypothetical protein